MTEELGSGISLDKNLDFSIDSTGDLKTEAGLDELQKDLAFQMIINLDEFIGQPPSGNLEQKVVARVASVAEADSRVDSVNKAETEVSFNDTREEITIKMIAEAEDEEQELIFEI